MSYLVLVRHGQSMWNLANKFTGWVDVPLSERGILEAMQAAKDLQSLKFDVAFTSNLIRAHQTLFSIMASQKRISVMVHDDSKHKRYYLHPDVIEKDEVPVYQYQKLNERFYGDLQGMDKDQARRRFGKEQVFKWRRSYSVRPPHGESLKDVCRRSVPCFEKMIMPVVKEKKNVLVSAHGNSLRAIIKHLDGISDDDIPHLELPTGKPIVYKYMRGKLLKDNHEHNFDRPLFWKEPESHKVKNS
ncbi:MAG: 2,3-bisphosphoglycerate-dependent phosphoglycerate mutase [Candidatus Woesearchaeota archaeon]